MEHWRGKIDPGMEQFSGAARCWERKEIEPKVNSATVTLPEKEMSAILPSFAQQSIDEGGAEDSKRHVEVDRPLLSATATVVGGSGKA